MATSSQSMTSSHPSCTESRFKQVGIRDVLLKQVVMFAVKNLTSLIFIFKKIIIFRCCMRHRLEKYTAFVDSVPVKMQLSPSTVHVRQ